MGTALSASSSVDRWRPTLPTPIFVLGAIACGLGVGSILSSSSSDLPIVTLVCLPIQIGLFLFLSRYVMRRGLALSVWIGFAWIVYFTVRMVFTQADRGNLNENSLVRAAGDDAFVWAWIVTTLGLAAFVLGVAISDGRRPSTRSVPDFNTKTLLGFATIGLLGRYAMVFGGIASGFIENIMSLYLLAFGALGYHAVTNPSVRRPLYTLVGLASMVGIVTSFKEAAIIPIAALAIGMAAAGFKVGGKRVALMVGFGFFVFLTVQGNRVAFDEGESVPIYMGAISAFTDYDLESGVRADPDRGLNDAVVDTMQGMSRRFGGVTSIIVVYERVPNDVEFLGGKSLWQPAASSVPMLPAHLDLEFQVLSMGRYFTTTFIAVDQEENASSQAITMLGDLYLNFGNVGVVLGMLAWGIAIGRLDKLVSPTSATRVGALVYLGHILIGVERNVAYLFVNGAIRVMVLLLVFRAVARWGQRETSASRLVHAGAA